MRGGDAEAFCSDWKRHHGGAFRVYFALSCFFWEAAISTGAPVFFLTAAEHWGVARGAGLFGGLMRRARVARFVGVGGELMAAAGCRLLANPVKRSAMLAGAFVTESWYWWKLLREIKEEMGALRPDVVVPIDSSAVNLRIARIGKESGLPVCYYVAPQVWASRPGRVKKIKAYVETLCCVLPFEEKYFKERGVNAVYVGHPMFDGAEVGGSQADAAIDLPGGEGVGPKLAIFPGSRKAEIDKHMPSMLEILSEIKGRFPRSVFVAAAPSEERAWQIRHHLRAANTPVEIHVGHADAIISWADLVLTKSGTTTLQVAKHGKPMVVMFAVPRLQWAFARHFILTPYIALVNILAGREVVPEFIPFHGSPLPVARECIELLSRPELREAMVGELKKVVAGLWPVGGELAADRVAGEVMKLVRGR